VASSACCTSDLGLEGITGLAQLGDHLRLPLVEPGVVDGDGGHVGQGDHAVHVLLAEPGWPSPPDLEDAEELTVQPQRDGQRRLRLLLLGQRHEVLADLLVGQVVVHLGRLPGEEDQAGHALAALHPQPGRLDHPVPDAGPHPQLVALAQQHAADVGVEQVQRAVADGQQELIQVPDAEQLLDDGTQDGGLRDRGDRVGRL
jgi:hypothetical protein